MGLLNPYGTCCDLLKKVNTSLFVPQNIFVHISLVSLVTEFPQGTWYVWDIFSDINKDIIQYCY